MRVKPYVGVTGITKRSQIESLVGIMDNLGWPQTHKLMAGMLSSYKALAWGQLSNRACYVPVSELDHVALDDRRVFNIIHFNSRADGLFAQVNELISRVRYADGVQLNIAWPWIESLVRLRNRIYTIVVLQVGPAAYNMIGGTPDSLVAALRPYEGLIDLVLLDPSAGTGKSFDMSYAVRNLEALVESHLPINFGIAGGLAADNIDKLSQLIDIYPNLSWDAQTRLRNGSDQLDLGLCREYLEASWQLITKRQIIS